MPATGKFLSNYIKPADVKSPTVLTISSAEEETFQKGKKDEETKLTLWFKEVEQGVVMNKTNIRKLHSMFGTKDTTDGWIGKQVTLYYDPAVTYGEKTTGGLRFREAK